MIVVVRGSIQIEGAIGPLFLHLGGAAETTAWRSHSQKKVDSYETFLLPLAAAGMLNIKCCIPSIEVTHWGGAQE